MRDYKCWFADDDESEADDVLGCFDESQAAEEFVEGRTAGLPDWNDHIDGDPIRVVVMDSEGNLTIWDVQLSTDITYNAHEVKP